MRTKAAIDELLPNCEESMQIAFNSIDIARFAVRRIEDKTLHKGYVDALVDLESKLEEKLQVDPERVKVLLGQKAPENKFIALYKREIAQLKASNESEMAKLYENEENATLSQRYKLIIGLFKEALLNEAVGEMDRARELMDDINGEFEDFNNAMENPELLLVHYQQFRQFAKSLGMEPDEDHTQAMEEKVEAKKESQKAQRKGFLSKAKEWIAGSDEAPEHFVDKETLDDVMVSYQNRFANNRTKNQLIVREREIDEMKKVETIVRSYVSALILAQSEEKVLEEFGMKKGETYSGDFVFTDQEFVKRMKELHERVAEIETGLQQGQIPQENVAYFRDELRALKYAQHKLQSGAFQADESQLGEIDADDQSARLVQVKGRITEADITDEDYGLMRDTFIQAITRDLAGREIIFGLDEQVKSEGRTSYDVEKAWETVKRHIPAFEEMDKIGIPQLVRTVGHQLLESGNASAVVGAAVDEYFRGYRERTSKEKIGHALTQGMNAMTRLKLRLNQA
jgi:hypothetical protein